MAEPATLDPRTTRTGSDISLSVGPAVSAWGRSSPLWRGILPQSVGQRVLILGYLSKGIFDSLLEIQEGVQIDLKGRTGQDDTGPYDLVLEEVRTQGFRPRPGPLRTPLVAAGGRWIAILRGAPAVGLHGRAVLRRARREGFQNIETFYAHPSLSSPKILVPLDRIEPIQYFLDFAMGVPTFRKRCLARSFEMLARFGIHREMLPNMILSARRST